MNQPTQIYQVSELVNEMQRLMETSYPEIWIEGELSSLSAPASGHLYFTLKDEHSQLRCAMFRSRASANRYRPKAGDAVRLRAKISVYSARGDLQCIVQYIEDAGEGVLQRRFEELKQKLNQAGLFSTEHKLSLPKIPRHIGLVTSPTGAAVKDILSTLKRRCPGIPVTIYPAVVQGEGAAKSLVNALSHAIQHQQVDVIILSRGGGSLEDLWCFNDEELANTIFQCPLPIVSGVGHEVDTTIADYVADFRAPTPTAAAELLSPDNLALRQQLDSLVQRLLLSTIRIFERRAQQVDINFHKLQHPKTTLALNRQKLQPLPDRLQHLIKGQLIKYQYTVDQCNNRLQSQHPRQHFKQQTSQVNMLGHRLLQIQRHSLDNQQHKLQALANQLHLVSPLATLERGYSIARDHNQIILRKSFQTKLNDKISLQLSSGTLSCRIDKIIS